MKNSEYLIDIIEHSDLIIYVKNSLGQFLFVNKKFETIFDLRRDNILGKTCTELFPKNIAAILDRNDHRVMQFGKTIEHEDYLNLPQYQRYFICSKFLLHGAFGQETSICAILTDITECKQTALSLKNIKIHYRSLFEESHDAQLIITPPAWEFQIANPAAIRMFGLSEITDFITTELSPWSLSPEQQPDGRLSMDAALAMIKIALIEGSHYFEWMHKRMNGEEFPCSVLLTRMQSNGEHYLQCSVRDITEQKKIELALQCSEERMPHALQAANDGLWDFNLETQAVYYSPRWKEILGYNPDELTPNLDTWTMLVHPEDKEKTLAQLNDYLEGRSDSYKAEFRMRHKQGHWVYILSRGILARDKQGKLLAPRRVIGTHLDITEQKQNEMLLRESEKRYRVIFESSHDAKITWSPKTRKFVDSNPAALKIFGVPDAQTFISLGPADVSPERQEDGRLSTEKSDEQLEKALQDGFNYFEWIHQCLNGKSFCSTVLLTRIEIAGEFYIQATIRDITEQKQIERKLRESEARYRKLFENSRDAMMIMSIRTNKIVECNQAALKLLKASGLAEINGLTPLEFSPEYQPEGCTSQEKFQEVLSATLRDGFHYFEWTHQCRNGEESPSDVLAFPVELEGELYIQYIHREMTEQRRAEAELRESEARYRSLFEGSHDAMVIFKANPLKFVTCNSAALKMFGVPDLETFALLKPLDLSPEKQNDQVLSRDKVRQVSELAMRNGFHYFEWIHKRLDGRTFPTTVMLSRSEINGELCLQATVRDITQQKNAEEQLRLAAGVFAHAREGIMITNANSVLIDVNTAFTYITGYERDEVIGKKPNILKSGRHDMDFYADIYRSLDDKGHWYGEIWNRRKNGEVYAALLNISQIRSEDGKPLHSVGIFTDITYIKTHQRELEHLAHYDMLTGLPNRTLLTTRLQQAMAFTKRLNKFIAVVFIDLDGFKAINDRYGHETGDKLLINIAKNMKDSFRKVDTLARIGGDEFIAVFQSLSTRTDCEPFVRRILTSVTKPIIINEQTLNITASIGISLYPQEEDASPDLLLRQADQAMYEAKLAGKNRFHFFDAAHDQLIRSQNLSLERIKLALDRREFVLYYQPKINLRTGHVFGAEALIRWQHPEKGLLAPASFLPDLENHPLDIELGEWVIDTALAQIETWRTMDIPMQISVNVGAHQLQQTDFLEKLSNCLANHPHVQPDQLELEVLETSALEDITRITNLIESCYKIGVGFVLDDFGTGYSSLSYLKRLPIRLIKIDQSFVRDMLKDKEDLAIIKGVVDLASVFHRNVIAEGVETAQHHRLLINLGCEFGQGYGIAKPMPAEALPAWLSTWRPDPGWLSAPVVSHDDLSLLFAKVAHDAGLIPDSAHLNNERSAPNPIKLSDCLLSHWLEGEGQQRFGDTSWYQSVVALHLQTHALATRLTKSSKNADHRAKDTQRIDYINTEKQLTAKIEKLFCSAPIKKHPLSH